MSQSRDKMLSSLKEPQPVSDSEVEQLIADNPGQLVSAWIVAADDDPGRVLFVAAGMNDDEESCRAGLMARRLADELQKPVHSKRGIGKVVWDLPENIVRVP